MPKTARSRSLVAATAVTGLVALAGCGGSSSDSGSGSGSGSGTPKAATYSAASISTFTDYTGATAGAADPSLSPVVIGNVNQETGPGALPELTRFLDAGVDLVNTQLGGIGGHPLKVQTCDVTSPETGLSCAQEFANDKTIVAVVENSISQGADSFHSVLDSSDIPIISALPFSPVDGQAPNSFYTSAGAFASVGAIAALTREAFKGSSIAVIVPEGDPVSAQLAAALGGQLKSTGIEVKQASFSASETDPTAALLAAGVGDADVIVPAVVTPPACIAVAKALTTLGSKAPVISLASCTSKAVSDALGDLPTWTYLYGFSNPDAPASDEQTKAEVAAYEQWWKPLGEDVVGVIGLQTALTVQRHLLAGGGAEATGATISDAARSWTGPIFLGPPEVKYGMPPFPALPTLAAIRAYTYQGDDSWKPELDSEWLGAPPQQ